ncbi:hypothetical protein DE146DRAFT_630630 [Phaeosphaeria sp. MPI-PUGE-AT-0046c]|nr:hypothetical protein DE146DRAFT_630630 [Phaeosphaeria sp. MPI-PUGE-AT-0046c]
MLLTTPTSLLASALLLSTSALAAPTRTHCRCTVVADAAPAAIFTPSAAHWTPAEPSSTPRVFEDPCTNLGPELETFQHTEPELYASYLVGSEQSASTQSDYEHDSQRPISRDVVTRFASAKERGLSARREAEESEVSRPMTRTRQRIVCHSEMDQFSEYQGSFVTLWILHVIVAVAILACIAEGVHLSLLRWYGRSDSTGQGVMRLPGSQNLVLEISSEGLTGADVEGGEKKGWTQATPMLIVQAPNGDRVCIRYEEDLDDEMYRPVM